MAPNVPVWKRGALALGKRISEGWKWLSSTASRAAVSPSVCWVTSRSPVLTSRKAAPKPSPRWKTAMKLLSFGSSITSSVTVPGVMIRVTSRLTSLPGRGSSSWSQMATL